MDIPVAPGGRLLQLLRDDNPFAIGTHVDHAIDRDGALLSLLLRILLEAFGSGVLFSLTRFLVGLLRGGGGV